MLLSLVSLATLSLSLASPAPAPDPAPEPLRIPINAHFSRQYSSDLDVRSDWLQSQAENLRAKYAHLLAPEGQAQVKRDREVREVRRRELDRSLRSRATASVRPLVLLAEDQQSSPDSQACLVDLLSTSPARHI